MDGTTWDVDRIVSVTDGDTLRVVRSRPFPIDGRSYRITDDDPRGVPIRLVWVDTPERGQPGRNEARLDLEHWADRHAGTQGPLRVVCYESAGYDRILGDLIDADGNSASQYLIIDRGWPVYRAR